MKLYEFSTEDTCYWMLPPNGELIDVGYEGHADWLRSYWNVVRAEDHFLVAEAIKEGFVRLCVIQNEVDIGGIPSALQQHSQRLMRIINTVQPSTIFVDVYNKDTGTTHAPGRSLTFYYPTERRDIISQLNSGSY